MMPASDVQTYDYIVVGAGSAGAVVANRLSADARNRVLLLEAGPASHPWSRIPIGYARLLTNPAANWLYSSEPEANTNGRKLPVPRGRLLGGSSAINGMAFVRGQAQDFDTWAQMGNQGWSYDSVLPFFKRMENYEGGDDRFRGRDGPLRITNAYTYQQGAVVYVRLYYANPGTATGFGFAGTKGSTLAPQTHSFASPGAAIVEPNSITYPFNEGCGTSKPSASYVRAWLDSGVNFNIPTKSVIIHLVCASTGATPAA